MSVWTWCELTVNSPLQNQSPVTTAALNWIFALEILWSQIISKYPRLSLVIHQDLKNIYIAYVLQCNTIGFSYKNLSTTKRCGKVHWSLFKNYNFLNYSHILISTQVSICHFLAHATLEKSLGQVMVFQSPWRFLYFI